MFWKKLFGEKREAGRQYNLPDGELVYAVGDIHGRADLLNRLCSNIVSDMAKRDYERATVVFLGDYIDRGFHSREVLEALISMQLADARLVFLAGNHEDMMIRFLDDPAEGHLWLGVGGLATLASYDVMVDEECDIDGLLDASNMLSSKLPDHHRAFLQGLEEHYQCGDYLFVHAGLRPGVPLAAQRRRDKLGIRREFTESDHDFGVKVVHGHTGVRKPLNLERRVSVDTGAFATGVLTAAVVCPGEVCFLAT